MAWKFIYTKILIYNTKNNLKELISLIENYKDGEYILKNDILYNEKNIINKNLNINGLAYLYKNEYGINGKIQYKNICIYKGVGNSKFIYYKGLCKNLNIKQSEVKFNQNNSQVTIEGDFDYYSVNKSNKIPDNWSRYSGNDLIIELPYVGNFYIWTKTKYGVVSNPIKVEVVCSLKEDSEISDSTIYCTGSKLTLNGYSWHVISDINGELKLLLDSGQIDLMSHCDNKINNDYCYYKSDILYKSYKWSDSKINEYLSNDFIKKYENYDLKEYKICDQTSGTSGCKDDDGCAGYLKEEVDNGKYSCNKYTKSKVRLLTYNEYNYILKNISDHKWLYGSKLKDFWLMNGYSKNGFLAFKINIFGQCYLDENTSSLLEVRPVITIYK